MWRIEIVVNGILFLILNGFICTNKNWKNLGKHDSGTALAVKHYNTNHDYARRQFYIERYNRKLCCNQSCLIAREGAFVRSRRRITQVAARVTICWQKLPEQAPVCVFWPLFIWYTITSEAECSCLPSMVYDAVLVSRELRPHPLQPPERRGQRTTSAVYGGKRCHMINTTFTRFHNGVRYEHVAKRWSWGTDSDWQCCIVTYQTRTFWFLIEGLCFWIFFI